MEKITKTLSMAGMFLFSGTLALMAETEVTRTIIKQIGNNITNLSDLKTGTQIIFHNNGRNADVFEMDTKRMEMGTAIVNDINSGNYVWTIKTTPEAKYQFESIRKNYIPTLNSGEVVSTSNEAANFTIKKDNNYWTISDGQNYFNGNDKGNGFVGWHQEGNNSIYEIKIVQTEEETFTVCNISVSSQSEQGKQLANTSLEVRKGDTYLLPHFFGRKLISVKNGEEEIPVNNDGSINITKDMAITCIFADDLLFQTSESFDKAVWYQINIHQPSYRSSWKFDNNNLVPADLNANNVYDDSQLWCFVGSLDEGIKIYNKKAGKDVCLTHIANNNTIGLGTENGNHSLWEYCSSSAYNNAACFKNKAYTGQYINYNGVQKKFGFWGNNDHGSSCFFTSQSLQLELDEAKFRTYLNSKLIGSLRLRKDQYNLAKAINTWKENPSTENYNAVVNLVQKSDKTSLISGKYYKIYTSGRNVNNYMGLGNNLKGVPYSSQDAAQIWQFIGDDTNGYKLVSEAMYIKQPNQSTQVEVSQNEQDAMTFTLNGLTDSPCLFNIHPKEGKNLHLDEQYKIVGWDNGGASNWYITRINDINITIGPALYTTVNYSFAFTIPDELKAYIVTSAEGDALFLTELKEKNIPANTPVILSGEAKKYTLTIIDNDDTETINTTNILTGNLLSCPQKESMTTYVLANKNNEVGFYKLKAGNNIPQNKAFYETTSANNIQMFSLDTDGEDGTTGIGNIENGQNKPEVYYDLQGRRVMNPTKGIYVTESGKKVLFNK